jgi:hypothetical protein
MATLLFRLNGVPADEADEVRSLLSEHRIDYYETDAGRWGISVAAIWLRDDAQLEAAQRLLDGYQRERRARVRQEYAARRAAGEHETLVGRLRRRPLEILFYAAAIATVLYLMIMPFVRRW